jgi:hypothetical protein
VSVIDFQKNRIAIEVENVRTWGAAVLRPYMIVPGQTILLAGESQK